MMRRMERGARMMRKRSTLKGKLGVLAETAGAGEMPCADYLLINSLDGYP